MAQITRRDFVRGAVIGLAALITSRFLAACRPQAESMPGVPQQPSVSPSPTPALTPSPVSPSRSGYPDLVVVRGGEPEELARRALVVLGGMGRFVNKGDDVIIKPNIGPSTIGYQYAATTNPWVVGAVVKMCKEAGARRVRVMDSPFGTSPEAGYANSGIQKEVLAAGGEMEIMSRFKFVSTEIPHGKDIKKWDIYDDVLKADVLIDIPIAKHHNLARLTLGMKNLMGLINNRPMFHFSLGQRLADLTSRVMPTLTIIDAVRILVANGPTGGDLNDVRKLDTVIASMDIVAADSYATGLFGLKPDDISAIRAASAMGLGQSDLTKLKIEEIKLDGQP